MSLATTGKTKPPADIVREFNTTAARLLACFERKTRSELELANIERLKKRISLAKSVLGQDILVKESYPCFVKYAEQIITRDENFFMEMNVQKEYSEYGKIADKQDEFIFALIDSVLLNYRKSSQVEKDNIYADVKHMFESALEYRLTAGNNFLF